MAQVTLWGASYSDVPAVELPKTGGGTARFDDTTDADATADDILSGKTAYVNGEKITGTGSGGGSVTQDQDGFIVLPPDGGGTPTVGGLEYETGSWTPGVDIARGQINFSGTHSVPPMYVALSDSTGTAISTTSTNVCCAFVDFYRLTGSATDMGASGPRYGLATYTYRSSGTNTSQAVNAITTTSDSDSASSVYHSKYWVTSTSFYPYSNSDSRYWKAGRTYKWIAVWPPTT